MLNFDNADTSYVANLLNQRIVIVARVRPFNQQELKQKVKSVIYGDPNDQGAVIAVNPQFYSSKSSRDRRLHERRFQFDFALLPLGGDQEEVFEKCCKPLIKHCLDGFNCCIIAYGQTGSGEINSIILPHRNYSVHHIKSCIAFSP